MARMFCAYNNGGRNIQVDGTTPREAASNLMERAKRVGARVKTMTVCEGDDTPDGVFSIVLGVRNANREWTIAPAAINTLPEA